MPTDRGNRRWPYFLVALAAVAGAVAFGARPLLAELLRSRSLKALQHVVGPGGQVHIGSADIELAPGNITWGNVRIDPVENSAATGPSPHALVQGTVARIAVRGISVWELLLLNKVHVHALDVQGADLLAHTADSTGQAPRPGAPSKPVLRGLRIDSLHLANCSFAWNAPDGPSTSLGVKVPGLLAMDVQVAFPHGNKPASWSVASVDGRLEQLQIGLPPLYDLTVAALRLPGPHGTLCTERLAFTPRSSPRTYGHVTHTATDLISFTADSITVQGLDLPAWAANHTLRAGELRICGANIHDFLDKTLPDPPYRTKHLPAKLLRDLPFPICLDSLVVDGLNVDYHEKGTATTSYGHVDFTNIKAVAKGICTLDPAAGPVLRLHATAMVYGQAPVRFNLQTALYDTSDHFSASAHIGALPFHAFNAMTGHLLLVQATDGVIDNIDYVLEADREQARGHVEMEYSGLKLAIFKHDGSGRKNALGSMLANTILHGRNIRGTGSFRRGEFAFKRSKGHGFFNYLWQGLRAGAAETVVPKAVLEAAQRQKPQKPAGHGQKSR